MSYVPHYAAERMQVTRVPFIVPGTSYIGAVVFSRFFSRNDINIGSPQRRRHIAHELCHYEQQRQARSKVWWHVRYLLRLVRYGYAAHPDEREARYCEKQPEWLAAARVWQERYNAGT